jgi:hypothetical protein
MVSPDSRDTACPLSGRNSTYRPVQISGTGSVGIPLDRSYKLAELIDRLVKHRPGSIMSETLSLIFSQYSTTGDLNIDLAEAA